MYNGATEDYKKAINSNIRTVGIHINITLSDKTTINLYDKDILQKSLYVNSRCVSGDDIDLGSTYASEFGVSIRYNGDITKLKKARVIPTFTLYIKEQTVNILLGRFRVDDVSLNGNYVKLICLDDMVLFNKKLSKSDMTHNASEETYVMEKTIGEYVVFCCSKCGVPSWFSSINFKDFPNADVSLAIVMKENALYTYRDVLESALELMGAFGTISREGYFEVKKFGRTPVATSTPHTRFKLTSNNYAIDSLRTFYKSIVTSSDESIYQIGIDNNRFLPTYEQGKNQEWQIVDRLNDINNRSLSGLSFSPCTIEYMGDPAIDVGDMIEVVPTIKSLHQYTYEQLENFTFEQLEQLRYGELSDYYLSDNYNAIVMQHNWVYRGKSTIYCYGKSAQLRKTYI